MPRTRCLAALVLVQLAACDPPGPKAIGVISVAPGIELASFSRLELRFYENPDGAFSTRVPPSGSTWQIAEVHLLSQLTFPYAYEIGPSMGDSRVHNWRVVAWLAPDVPSDWPSHGEPMATRLVPLPPLNVYLDRFNGRVGAMDLDLERQP